MNVLLDTNILARLVQPAHPQQPLAVAATDPLDARGDRLCLVPQVLYEFWVVATRPAAQIGLGLTAAEAAAEVARILGLFTLLPETPAVFPEWQRLVTTHAVIGKNGHDAHLVAAMAVHGVTHLLTFNVKDYTRFPGIAVLDPAAVSP
jgi:predicted nucleic acid-binding protein